MTTKILTQASVESEKWVWVKLAYKSKLSFCLLPIFGLLPNSFESSSMGLILQEIFKFSEVRSFVKAILAPKVVADAEA